MCHYRLRVSSGIWNDTEYAKLPRYDPDLPEQPVAVFLCHRDDGCLACSTDSPLFPIDETAARIAAFQSRVRRRSQTK